MTADLLYLAVGVALVVAVVLPELLGRWAVSTPMVLMGLGVLLGLTPVADDLPLDPVVDREVVLHVTELTVVVALMGVGLAIDRPFVPWVRRTWRTWAATWRLLAVAMPLSIAGTALLGWWAGLAPASALLLGAALAPTDPVLASDVQVAGPRTGEDEVEEDDEVRFTLTSEAGLNDALAFPFVYAAIMAATLGPVTGWWLEWVAVDLVLKVVVGVAVGVGAGWLFSRGAFHSRSRALRTAERGESLLAVAALVTAYGAGQVAGGYGFLSVFACAMTFRSSERGHDYHAAMHSVVERLERLLTLVVLLGLGTAISRGVLGALDWHGVAVGLGLLLVVRPLAGRVSLVGRHRQGSEAGRMLPGERWAVAFFGVRGVGSLYYVAYATGEASFAATDWLWSCVAFTVLASVVVHGVAATPVMARLAPGQA